MKIEQLEQRIEILDIVTDKHRDNLVELDQRIKMLEARNYGIMEALDRITQDIRSLFKLVYQINPMNLENVDESKDESR